MFKEIRVQRLSTGTIFKLVGLGSLLSLVPFSILMGCLALFGAATVTWNNQPLTGWSGLLASPFIGILLAGVLTMLLGSCMALGLWVYSWFRPLKVVVRIPGESGNAQPPA